MAYQLAKYEATGNDFLLVEHDSLFASPQWAIALCDRKTGIGADGILVVERGESGSRMVIYNADGTRPEMCGNGVRCVSAYIEQMEGKDRFPLVVLSDAGPKRVERVDFKGDSRKHYAVSMGSPLLQEPVTVSYNGKGRLLYRVNMGNPHAISFDSDLFNDQDLWNFGALLNDHHHAFPDGVNLEIVDVDAGFSPIRCRVFERGVGETLACGTGACAVAVSLIEAQKIQENSVDVSLPGGPLHIEWSGRGTENETIFMTGPASFVADVTMSEQWVLQNKVSLTKSIE